MLLAAALKFYLHLARARQLTIYRCSTQHRSSPHTATGESEVELLYLLSRC